MAQTCARVRQLGHSASARSSGRNLRPHRQAAPCSGTASCSRWARRRRSALRTLLRGSPRRTDRRLLHPNPRDTREFAPGHRLGPVSSSTGAAHGCSRCRLFRPRLATWDHFPAIVTRLRAPCWSVGRHTLPRSSNLYGGDIAILVTSCRSRSRNPRASRCDGIVKSRVLL